MRSVLRKVKKNEKKKSSKVLCKSDIISFISFIEFLSVTSYTRKMPLIDFSCLYLLVARSPGLSVTYKSIGSIFAVRKVKNNFAKRFALLDDKRECNSLIPTYECCIPETRRGEEFVMNHHGQ